MLSDTSDQSKKKDNTHHWHKVYSNFEHSFGPTLCPCCEQGYSRHHAMIASFEIFPKEQVAATA